MKPSRRPPRANPRQREAPELEITIVNRQRQVEISTRGLASFLKRLEQSCPSAADSVALCLVSDRRMREINREFAGKDATTDVLSFPADETGPDGVRHLGDVVISVPRAKLQARARGHSVARESKILALHGYLHLLGYDHEADDGEMMRLQARLTRRLLPRRRARQRGAR